MFFPFVTWPDILAFQKQIGPSVATWAQGRVSPSGWVRIRGTYCGAVAGNHQLFPCL